MTFAVRLTSDLLQIVRAGGSLNIEAKARLTSDLVQIARAAKQGGATVTFTGMSLRLTSDLVQIARAGQGHVTFAD